MVYKTQSYHPLKIAFRIGINIYHHFQTYNNYNNKPNTKKNYYLFLSHYNIV